MPPAECLADQGFAKMRVREPDVLQCVEMRASAVTDAHCPSDKDTRLLAIRGGAAPARGRRAPEGARGDRVPLARLRNRAFVDSQHRRRPNPANRIAERTDRQSTDG
jgi:hypothetical protein